MARIRTIKPEFWEDEKIASLSMPCRLFFIGTWSIADDAGVFRANVALLKSKIFPYDDIRVTEIQKYLDALVEARMILPISHNGESFYVIRTFRSHQKFDARYPNYLINNEILSDLMRTQSSSDEHPTGTQRVPSGDTPREGDRDREIIPPLIPPNGGNGESEEKWWESFNVYLSEFQKAYKLAINDQKWMAQREKFHPNLNIKRSLSKAYTDFWGTELGWCHKKEEKKKKKTDKINWKATLANALTQKMNQVYNQRNE